MSFPLPFGPEAIPFTKDIFVRNVPYNPFASPDQYAAFRRSSEGGNAAQQIGEFSTGTLLRTRPARGVVWWNVNVWAKERIWREGVDPQPQQQDVQGNGQQVSSLKVRVSWTEFPSRERDIFMDLGAGFTIGVGPTTQVGVELMVPDTSKFTGVIPPEFDNLRVSTYVVASCWAVQAPIGRPSGRSTQAAFLRGAAVAGPTQSTQFVPIADGARFVQIFGSRTGGGNAGGALLTPPSFRIQDNLLVRPVGRISFPALDENTPKTEIAQNAKFIELTSIDNAEAVFNVVQELEL